MASSTLFLAASVLFAQSTLAFNCSQPPIYVDIHKRAVHGTDVFQYGSFIGVGNPSQNQSLWPSLRQNQTSFASAHYCDNSNLTNCAQSTRGNFDPTLSTTFNQDNNYQSLDSTTNQGFEGIFAQDDLHLYTHYFETDGATQNVITNYTIEVANNGSIAPGIVGMGLSSTLLQSLYDRGMIAGRTYSLYIGSGMDRAGGVINGSNTFGGFDAGRFEGDVHKYPMNISNENPMSVHIKDITINDPTGKNVSIFDSASFPDGFEAKLTTDQYPLSLPHTITQNYISELSASPSTNPDGSLKLNNPFNGTMSITLDDGFVVTFPPDVMYNASGLSPVASRAENDSSPYLMSVAFLTQVYLMADFENYQFFLAKAIQEQKAVMPRTFCPKATPAPYAPPKTSSFVANGLIGAVIGGIVGGSGILIFASCLFLSLRRSRAEKKAERQYEIEKGVGKGKRKGGKGPNFAHFEVDDKEVEFEPPPKTPKTATPFLGLGRKSGR